MPWPKFAAPMGGSTSLSHTKSGFLLEEKPHLQISPKSAFTIHDDIFQRPVELKIFMWA